jgi:hypothetical protein
MKKKSQRKMEIIGYQDLRIIEMKDCHIKILTDK